jgi:hypothetical protein
MTAKNKARHGDAAGHGHRNEHRAQSTHSRGAIASANVEGAADVKTQNVHHRSKRKLPRNQPNCGRNDEYKGRSTNEATERNAHDARHHRGEERRALWARDAVSGETRSDR